MKKFFKLAVVALMIIACPHFAKSQTVAKATPTTVAHLDLDSLLKIMPAFTKATDSANAYQTYLENQLYSLQVEYARKTHEYDSLEKVWSPLIKGLRAKEIQDLENNIQSFQQLAQDELTQVRSSLYEPIFEKVDSAVKAIAIARGYKIVLDSTKGQGVLYASPSDDIFTDVRIKLGIPAPSAVKPKPAPAPAPTPGANGGIH